MPSAKQAPVIERLRFLLQEAAAVAAGIRDNAQDDHEPLDPESVLDLVSNYQTVLDLLDEAFNLPIGPESPAKGGGACSIG